MQMPTKPVQMGNDAGDTPTYRHVFSYQEISAPKGSAALRCHTRAKLEASQLKMQGVMVRLPSTLRRRIESQTAGALLVTLCALAEYALDLLEAENKGIIVSVAPETKA